MNFAALLPVAPLCLAVIAHGVANRDLTRALTLLPVAAGLAWAGWWATPELAFLGGACHLAAGGIAVTGWHNTGVAWRAQENQRAWLADRRLDLIAYRVQAKARRAIEAGRTP